MQAIILSAGRGTRMGELTAHTPKPLLEVNGKTLLEHKFDALPREADEIILVVGYLGDLIRRKFGTEYKGKKITYAEQGLKHGTAGALWSAKKTLKDRFIVMMGDDVYSRADIERAMNFSGWSLVVHKTEEMGSGGRIIVGKDGLITDIEEGHHAGKSGLISTNLFLLDTRIFGNDMVPKLPGSSEFGLPQTALIASQKLGIQLEALEATFWVQITAPEDLKKAEELLAKIEK